ncbi:MAG: hypothetical protein PVJ60_00765 [Phycisphaerales bacterium]|jgi:hypothetical protein
MNTVHGYDEQTLEEPSVSKTKSLMRKLPTFLFVLFLCGTVLLIYSCDTLLMPPASELFKQYVMDPIPASVTNIKADQPKTIGGYGYVFRFDINRADLDLIIKSRPFREAQLTNFSDSGSISWNWKGLPSYGSIGERGRGFGIYGVKRRKPSWYTLESWENPETYALVEEKKDVNTSDIQVLIYNVKLGQAFFIVFDYGGEAIWGRQGNPPSDEHFFRRDANPVLAKEELYKLHWK